MKKIINCLKRNILSVTFAFLLVMPASTSYKLDDYGFGSGGTGSASSSHYKMDAITGEISGQEMSSSSYKAGSGLIFINQANVPIAPAFSNPGNYYNKLQIIINTSGNPSDTNFAVAISNDDFVTTSFVQSDNTVGITLGAEDYRTYEDWGEAGGSTVIGLSANTNYKVKAKAMQGNFTETSYGPAATAATVSPALTFDIDVSDVDTETDPPFSINFGDLIAGVVTDSPQKIWVDLSTNGESGGNVYVSGQNGGLLSSTKSYRIDAVSDNLTELSQGFGAQGSSATLPLAVTTLYNQTGNMVGILDQTKRGIFTSTTPVDGGRGSFFLKAKSSAITPAAGDYNETLTLIASGNY